MGNKWTAEQLNAIEKRGCDILVSAAAGSGKTAVLVERIIKIITDKDKPVDIDRLLVLTFTNAAAREMRERIGASLLKLLRENPKDINLKNQLTLLNKAQITTIHAFCMEVVRKNYAAINIDPSFRIADDAESEIIKGEVLEELFEEKYSSGDEDFIALVESFDTGFKDSGLRNNLLEVYKFVRSNPFPERWIDEMVERYNLKDGVKFEESFIGRLIVEEIKLRLDWARKNAEAAVAITAKPMGPTEYFEALNDDLNLIDTLDKLLERGIESFEYGLNEVKHKTLARKKKETDSALAEEAKDLRDRCKKEIKKISESVLIKNIEEIEQDIKDGYPFLKALGELVKEFDKKFDEAKRKKQLMDFNDLEHYAVKALVKEDGKSVSITDCAKNYRDRFYEILTDEYQDSNMVQELILSAVSKGENRFMVGDVKQSIYKFRMAKPEIFMEKYNSFLVGEGRQVRIDLYKNFRSRKNVLDGINFIFENIMSQDLGEIEYDEAARLDAGASFEDVDDDTIELHILEKEGIEEKEEEGDLAADEIEARHIAKKIKELIKNGYMVTEKSTGELRKANYGDVAILMRGVKAANEVYTDVFEREGIPLKTEMTSGFFNTTEIMTVTNVLSVIDNPRQDIPLISVLYSPIYGFSASDLMKIRLMDKKKDFYDCAREYVSRGEDESITKKLEGFFKDLDDFRSEAGHIAISDLLLKIYNDTGYFDMAGASLNGETRQANLRLLINKAENYEKSNFHGLFNFIKYIERIKTTGIEIGEAKINSGEANAVSLMTIHKSKGLEYPIVFVAGMGKKFNKQDGTKSVLMHQELGFGVKNFDYKNRVVYETVSRKVIGERIVREGLSEELRVLYVALTRARDKLFMVGSVDDIKKKVKHWGTYMFFEKMPYFNLLGETAALDWIAPCIMRHKDGKELRNILDVEEYCYGCVIKNYESNWKVNIVTKIGAAEEKEEKEKTVFDADKNEVEKIKEKLGKKYSYENVAGMPANISISELKRIYQEQFEEREVETDAFRMQSDFEYADFEEKEEKLSAAKKGTAVHTVMEHIDFKADIDKKYIEQKIAELVAKNVLTDDEGRSINPYKILNFFKNPIYDRIKLSKGVYKEEAFAMTIKSGNVFGEKYANTNEDILLHGIIDCYFEEDDGLILLDYKTDFITSEEDIKNRYRLQMDMYKLALQNATGKIVKEVYIYLFGTDKIIDMR